MHGRGGDRRLRGWAAHVMGALAAVLLVLGVAAIVISPRLAEHFIFFPSRMGAEAPPVLAGVRGRDVWLTSGDGVRIHGWWYHASEGAPGLLFLHGNAGHIGDRSPIAEGLVARGLSVFQLDYRGYGRSEGRPTEEGVQRDALAGHAWVADALGGEDRVVVLGESLGGPVAARLAAERRVGGLILQSTFTALDEMAAAAYPILPRFLFRRLRGHFDTRAALARVRAPVLVIHGTRDGLVPARMGRELFERASGPKTWLPIEGADHSDVYLVGGARYFDAVAAFAQAAGGAR